jgi:hypothetical protein
VTSIHKKEVMRCWSLLNSTEKRTRKQRLVKSQISFKSLKTLLSRHTNKTAMVISKMTEQLRCERCGRFIGEDCLEGWDGGFFGDYNGRYYCAVGVGCNKDELKIARVGPF